MTKTGKTSLVDATGNSGSRSIALAVDMPLKELDRRPGQKRPKQSAGRRRDRHSGSIYADHSDHFFLASFLLPNAKTLSKMKITNFVALSQTVLAAADAGSCKSPPQ